MEIRQALTAYEIESARQLFRGYADSLGIDLGFQGFAEELVKLPNKYAPPFGRLLVAWTGDEAIGCVALRPLADHECEIKRLFVRPEYRSAGVGKQLTEATIAEAQHIGYGVIRLDTLPTMNAAIRLYESLGFRRCEAYYSTPIQGTVFMELSL